MVLAMKNAKPGVSRFMLGFYGYRMFDSKYFTERGRWHQNHMGLGMLAFVVLPLFIMLLSFLYKHVVA